jgi:hypothetical protein
MTRHHKTKKHRGLLLDALLLSGAATSSEFSRPQIGSKRSLNPDNSGVFAGKTGGISLH